MVWKRPQNFERVEKTKLGLFSLERQLWGTLITESQFLWGDDKEDGGSQGAQEKARDSRHELYHRRIHPGIQKKYFTLRTTKPLEQHPQECCRVPITGTSQRWLGRALNNPMQVPKTGLSDLSSSLPICLMDCFVIPWFYTESQRLFVSWPKLRMQASILRPRRIIFLPTYKSNS